jgi:hypothetical protein
MPANSLDQLCRAHGFQRATIENPRAIRLWMLNFNLSPLDR